MAWGSDLYFAPESSYVPPPEQRDWRLLSREGIARREDIGRHRNRIEVLLEQAQLKLSCVVSDVLGVSGRRILRALLDGVTDPDKLAMLAQRKILATKEEIAEALRGNLSCSQHLALKKHLDSLERIEVDIADLETELAKPQAAQQPVLQRLCEIPGIGVRAAQPIISEIGPNPDAFATAGKLASWVGACPGMCESGGVSMSSRCAKANPYLRRLFCQIAWAATMAKDSPSRHKYHKLKSRLGPQKAIWAVAHYLVRLVWTILHSPIPYKNPEPVVVDRRTLLKRATFLKAQLARIGYSLIIQTSDPETLPA